MKDDKHLYYDPETNTISLGEGLEEVQKKLNEKFHDRGYVSYWEVMEMIAESIENEQVREEFLKGFKTPWKDDDIGFISCDLYPVLGDQASEEDRMWDPTWDGLS